MNQLEIQETRQAKKDLDKAPSEIVRSYEIWARLIEEHGTEALRSFKGYHDEALKGDWQGFRSSRLNLKWRVIYQIAKDGQIKIVNVMRITPHDYRRG